jgi:hypothetical protein
MHSSSPPFVLHALPIFDMIILLKTITQTAKTLMEGRYKIPRGRRKGVGDGWNWLSFVSNFCNSWFGYQPMQFVCISSWSPWNSLAALQIEHGEDTVKPPRLWRRCGASLTVMEAGSIEILWPQELHDLPQNHSPPPSKFFTDLFPYFYAWVIWKLPITSQVSSYSVFYWVFGLFPSSSILEKRKHDVSETGSVSVLRWRSEDTYLVWLLRKS